MSTSASNSCGRLVMVTVSLLSAPAVPITIGLRTPAGVLSGIATEVVLVTITGVSPGAQVMSTAQVAEQPSPGVVLLSSQASGPSMMPLPHTGSSVQTLGVPVQL